MKWGRSGSGGDALPVSVSSLAAVERGRRTARQGAPLIMRSCCCSRCSVVLRFVRPVVVLGPWLAFASHLLATTGPRIISLAVLSNALCLLAAENCFRSAGQLPPTDEKRDGYPFYLFIHEWWSTWNLLRRNEKWQEAF